MLSLGGPLLQSLPDMIAKRAAVEFSEGSQHLREQHAFRPGVVDVLRDRNEAHLVPAQYGQALQRDFQSARPAVESMNHDHVKLVLAGILQKLLEHRAAGYGFNVG